MRWIIIIYQFYGYGDFECRFVLKGAIEKLKWRTYATGKKGQPSSHISENISYRRCQVAESRDDLIRRRKQDVCLFVPFFLFSTTW